MTAPAPAPEPGAAEAPPPGALSRLVEQAHDDGDSYQRMADRAVDPDSGEQLVSKPYLQKMVRTPPAKAPNLKEMRGIALAVRQPLRLVQRATAEQYLGYTATEVTGYGEDMRRVVGHLESMSPREVARWLAMMEAAAEADHGEK